MGYIFWYIKINPTQNHNSSTSLDRYYKGLLIALISFEIRHSKLKLWAAKEKTSKLQQQKSDMWNSLESSAYWKH